MSTLDIALIFSGAFTGAFLNISQLSGALGMSLLLPLCFVLKPDSALYGILAIYCGSKIGRGEGAFAGGLLAAFFAALLIPFISRSVNLSQSEFLALGIFIMISVIFTEGKQQLPFSIASIGAGLLIPTVGIDITTGVERYTLGFAELQGGIDIIVVILGICCIGEILYLLKQERQFKIAEKLSPGLESSLSARSIGELVPAMSLGLPCTSETAILVGMFSLYGMAVPSTSFTSAATMLISGITAKVLFGAAIGRALNAVKKTKASYFITPKIIYPMLVTVAFCGAYSLNYRVLDMLFLILFGFIGFAMRKYRFPIAPFLVGLVLSTRVEQTLHTQHSWTWLNVAIYILTALIILNTLRQWRRQNTL